MTNFDQQVQEIIIEEIRKNYPEDKILAEEAGRNTAAFDRSQDNFGFWILLMVR